MHGPKFRELGEMWTKRRQKWNDDKLMLDMTHSERYFQEPGLGGVD